MDPDDDDDDDDWERRYDRENPLADNDASTTADAEVMRAEKKISNVTKRAVSFIMAITQGRALPEHLAQEFPNWRPPPCPTADSIARVKVPVRMLPVRMLPVRMPTPKPVMPVPVPVPVPE
jgi:hypothetical protein